MNTMTNQKLPSVVSSTTEHSRTGKVTVTARHHQQQPTAKGYKQPLPSQQQQEDGRTTTYRYEEARDKEKRRGAVRVGEVRKADHDGADRPR